MMDFRRRRILRILLAGLLGLGSAWQALRWGSTSFSASRHASVPLREGNVQAPEERSQPSVASSQLTDAILEHWASVPLEEWRESGKTNAPRALMGRLALRRDIDQVNAYIMSVTPWGRVGSTWSLNRDGDYDFTLAALVPILFQFGDDPTVLYPDTVDHLVRVLLTVEGGQPELSVPSTLGLVRDTENHILMTEGSRYLKNRWMRLHGSPKPLHDNVANGLESWLLDHLEELRRQGLYEFNSIPYEGYTLTALLNLEAFGSVDVRASARRLLDQLNWQYALGSSSLRQFAPFRRQRGHSRDTALDGDYQTALMKAWLSLTPDASSDFEVRGGGYHHALWACWSPYRLPDQTAQWALNKPRDYLVRLGHGPESSPEIYSGGPGYLLTAGGVGRGRSSLVVCRPTTLMLDDGASKLSDLIHLAGPGMQFDKWNNTGVWRKFAVAAGPVHIPEGWDPAAKGPLWSVYQRGQHGIAVASSPGIGIVYLSRSANPHAVLSAVADANNDPEELRKSFTIPQGVVVEYALQAPRDRWVITSVDGTPVDRELDKWPLMDEM